MIFQPQPIFDFYRRAPEPISGNVKPLNSTLEALICRALQVIMSSPLATVYRPEEGLIAVLKKLIELERDTSRKSSLIALVNNFGLYFRMTDPDDPASTNGRILTFITPDKVSAYLCLVPPRGDGDIPTEIMVKSILEKEKITYNVDEKVLEKALKTLRENNDVVWAMKIAEGVAPKPRKRRINYKVNVINKALLHSAINELDKHLLPWPPPIVEGSTIGELLPLDDGVPGIDVSGCVIEPPSLDTHFDFDEDIILEKNIFIAKNKGYVVVDEPRIDIVPFYVMEKPAAGSIKNFSFNGNVLVIGNLIGPGSIECEDIFILGNCEQIDIQAKGDVFVSGGIMGHRERMINADGSIYASFISDAKVSALGRIVVLNAIINSSLVSNDYVEVISPKGMIAGGKICSLKTIKVATMGSEFGMLTETIVGKDFLTKQRLEEINKHIEMHEQNIRKIQILKSQLAAQKIPIEKLPPDKQELFLGVLRKEKNSMEELKSLMRRKKTLSQSLGEFLEGTVYVLNTLYPPVKIQILDAISEIREKLNAVTIYYSKGQGIVSQPTSMEGVKSNG